MLNDHHLRAAQQRYDDLCQEVAIERLRQQVQPITSMWYAPVLLALGNTLVAWGWWLRGRYGRLELSGER
jgi:hypothetical protein